MQIKSVCAYICVCVCVRVCVCVWHVCMHAVKKGLI